MINPNELRLGNYILCKSGVRILPTQCTYLHFDLFSKGQVKDSFPISLKPDILVKCGFNENKKYYAYPEVREFVLTLPVIGQNKNEVLAYVNATENYARAVVNDLIVSNHFYHVHQLQNLYYAFVGKEMELSL